MVSAGQATHMRDEGKREKGWDGDLFWCRDGEITGEGLELSDEKVLKINF